MLADIIADYKENSEFIKEVVENWHYVAKILVAILCCRCWEREGSLAESESESESTYPDIYSSDLM